MHQAEILRHMADWSPSAYLRFADERARPASDLLAQIPLKAPQLVYDLGCGPGNSTALLARAYPTAEIIGIDSSPAMLATARQDLPQRQFIEADLKTWVPGDGADLLYSNATFQWVPDHAAVLLRLLKHLGAGAVLALQMPDNLDEPSHVLMRETAGDGPWADKLREASGARTRLGAPRDYHELLRPHCTRLDIWHTAYNHVLDGVQGIIDLVSSTGLRPFLNLLVAAEQKAFVENYRMRLASAYPALNDGRVMLRFPRLFIVAQA
jgi:trans-aconitate 2-methyltransferase